MEKDFGNFQGFRSYVADTIRHADPYADAHPTILEMRYFHLIDAYNWDKTHPRFRRLVDQAIVSEIQDWQPSSLGDHDAVYFGDLIATASKLHIAEAGEEIHSLLSAEKIKGITFEGETLSSVCLRFLVDFFPDEKDYPEDFWINEFQNPAHTVAAFLGMVFINTHEAYGNLGRFLVKAEEYKFDPLDVEDALRNLIINIHFDGTTEERNQIAGILDQLPPDIKEGFKEEFIGWY